MPSKKYLLTTMRKQASQVCLSFFVLLSLLANYSSVSANQSDQSNAPAPSESAITKSFSPESLPVLLDPNNIPDVETKSNETLSQDNISTGEEILSQELASSPISGNDPTIETKGGDENISNSLSPNSNIVDNSVLDARDMDNLSQQENTSLPPSDSIVIPQASPAFAPNVDISTPGVEENNKSPALAPASAGYVVDSTPALDQTSDDGSFSQENQSSVAYVNAPAPETKGDDQQEITDQDYSSSATSPNTETTTQNPENVPQLDDYSPLPKAEVPAPTIQMTPLPNDDSTFGLAAPPTSTQNTILPFNYRAEDEAVEPYNEEEEESWNGAAAGVVVGACVIGGVGGFVYQKRKKDNIRAQYHCLAKKEGV